MDNSIFEAILNAYTYEVVYVNREHIVEWMNDAAKRRYGERVKIGASLFNCHNEGSKKRIEELLQLADEGQNEMFELYNQKTGEREFFVPVRKDGKVVGYFERHEVPWTKEECDKPVGDYWLNRV